MARDDTHRLSSPTVTLFAMVVFVVLVGFLALILFRQIASAFATNPGLNGLILGVLAVGVLLGFMQVLRLFREIRWVNAFRDGSADRVKKPVLLAPMAELLREREEASQEMALSTASTRTILDSIGNRLDERRDTSRYLISLLVFLGLLGTFWGLLGTIGSIGDTIRSLDPGSGATGDVLDSLKTGLATPLEGMGTAFSSSLFGLAGSLVLGFLDLQAGQAQNRFYLEVENWLSSVTDVSGDVGAGGEVEVALERLATSVREAGAREGGGQRATAAMASLAEGVQGLVKHMRAEQQMIRDWVEAQSQTQDDMRRLLTTLQTSLDAERAAIEQARQGPVQNLVQGPVEAHQPAAQSERPSAHETQPEPAMPRGREHEAV